MNFALAIAFLFQTAGGAGFRFGVADTRPARSCVALPGAPLAKGSPVVLVALGESQQVARATVAAQVASCEGIPEGNVDGPYYQLESDRALDQMMGLAIAVAGEHTARIVDGSARLALNTRYPNVRFRSCASSEGLHLTVWAGEPLKSARLWHVYWYLGYDVEPNCKPGDYRE